MVRFSLYFFYKSKLAGIHPGSFLPSPRVCIASCSVSLLSFSLISRTCITFFLFAGCLSFLLSPCFSLQNSSLALSSSLLLWLVYINHFPLEILFLGDQFGLLWGADPLCPFPCSHLLIFLAGGVNPSLGLVPVLAVSEGPDCRSSFSGLVLSCHLQ